MLKKMLVKQVKFYQFFSAFLPGKCRYYPTCSEYAVWQFETNDPHLAFYHSAKRIMSCNPMFDGGVDYPIIKKKLFCINPKKHSKNFVKYWYIPTNNKNQYTIIKNLKV